MKEDLTHLLICWKNDERRLGIRKVKIRNSPAPARIPSRGNSKLEKI
jgi:hypothetical protein